MNSGIPRAAEPIPARNACDFIVSSLVLSSKLVIASFYLHPDYRTNILKALKADALKYFTLSVRNGQMMKHPDDVGLTALFSDGRPPLPHLCQSQDAINIVGRRQVKVQESYGDVAIRNVNGRDQFEFYSVQYGAILA
jgi:hypothetical protein